jgi:4,5:9,10-diseco-3-hydroxy-5,9,17-trioxoandrosta-1(10),2-diene-4-oate hydrolase
VTDFVPKGRFADIGNGLSIHYHEVGEGPAVVFLHGSGPGASGWSNFKGNYPHFAEAGFRTLVPDILGFGYSTKAEDAQYTIDYMADGIVAMLDALDIQRFALVGNSMGGAVAIRIALTRPSRVTQLILMAPGGLEPRETYMNMEGIKAMVRVIFGREGVTRDSLKRLFELQLYDPSMMADEVLDERLSIAQLQTKRVIETMRIPNQTESLPDLQCPVLGFWGTDDKFCPVSGAMTLATGCKDAQVLVLSQCGHWVMVEHPATFNRHALAFLRPA